MSKAVVVPVKQLQQWAKGLHDTGWLWIAKEMEAMIAAPAANKQQAGRSSTAYDDLFITEEESGSQY
jgi:hypothetical protein